MPVVGWIVSSALLSLLWAIVGFLVVLPFGGDEYTGGEYVVVVLFGAFAWPFYMGGVYWVSRHAGRAFRVRALGLAVILALPFNVGSLFVLVPEITAATLAYALIGLTVRRAPREDPGPDPATG